MAKINLLPWRAELREQRKKEFMVTIGAVFLLAVVLAGLTWMFFNARLSDQQQANQQVTAANESLDQKLKALAIDLSTADAPIIAMHSRA